MFGKQTFAQLRTGFKHCVYFRLQALVYDILPSTTAVFSYAIESGKLSANEQFFVGGQTVVRLLQTTQIKQGVSFIAANRNFTPAQTKPQSFESRRNSSFLPGVDASHVYVRALTLGCFYSHISTRTFRWALTVGGQLRGDKECPFSGVTKSGRVWRKVRLLIKNLMRPCSGSGDRWVCASLSPVRG